MCEQILNALVTGAPLDATATAHAETCARCRAMLAVIGARPDQPPAPPLPSPTPQGLHQRARARTARRLTIVGLTAAAIALLIIDRAPEPPPLPAEEPDLLALLDEVDAIPDDVGEDPPGTEVLAMLDPLSQSPLDTTTDPVDDILPWSTP